MQGPQTDLEVLWQFLGVIGLVVVGGVEGTSHPEYLQIVPQFWCELGGRHVKPFLPTRSLLLRLGQSDIVCKSNARS